MAQYDVQGKVLDQKKSSNSSAKTVQLRHNNVASIIQMAKINPEMLTQNDVMVLQKTMGNGAVSQLINGAGEEQNETIQKKDGKLGDEKPLQMKNENNTGLPDNLKMGVENLSGLSMDDARVHYNSDKPAQVGALAYTQGTDIHVAPGQEKHLPHEAWHVVQQAQGRVKPTMQMKGVAVNDDVGLEGEADDMGKMAIQMKKNPNNIHEQVYTENLPLNKSSIYHGGNLNYVIQGVFGEEVNDKQIEENERLRRISEDAKSKHDSLAEEKKDRELSSQEAVKMEEVARQEKEQKINENLISKYQVVIKRIDLCNELCDKYNLKSNDKIEELKIALDKLFKDEIYLSRVIHIILPKISEMENLLNIRFQQVKNGESLYKDLEEVQSYMVANVNYIKQDVFKEVIVRFDSCKKIITKRFSDQNLNEKFVEDTKTKISQLRSKMEKHILEEELIKTKERLDHMCDGIKDGARINQFQASMKSMREKKLSTWERATVEEKYGILKFVNGRIDELLIRDAPKGTEDKSVKDQQEWDDFSNRVHNGWIAFKKSNWRKSLRGVNNNREYKMPQSVHKKIQKMDKIMISGGEYTKASSDTAGVALHRSIPPGVSGLGYKSYIFHL